MFSTCLICHRNLGANEEIETFSVGKRLAFDAHTGRLWAVCKKCGHWNLSPIEERWEAIESCDRLFRESRIKASTDNIGLTTIKSGLDIIRIGKPMRPEFSAWRYGARILARQKRGILIGAGGLLVSAGTGALVVGTSLGVLALAAYGMGSLGLVAYSFAAYEKFHEYREYERDVLTVTGTNGHRYYLKQKHLNFISLETSNSASGWELAMHHERGTLNLSGMQAAITAGQVLAHLNAKGASRKMVNRAALSISDAGNAHQFIRDAIKLRDQRRSSKMLVGEHKEFDSFGLRYEERLAVEMAMHEDTERQALEGELGALEDAWREAEEIGAISDRMFDKQKSGAP